MLQVRRREAAGAPAAAAVLVPLLALLLPACGESRAEKERKGRETGFVQKVREGNAAAVAEALAADPGLVTAVDESERGFVRPLHEAIRRGSVPLVRLLLEKGVGPNAPEANGKTPLHQWTETGLNEEKREEILDLLAGRRADLEAADGGGERPLHLAAQRHGSPQAVELLLQKGAQLESRNGRSRTPLLEAATFGEFRSAVPLCAWGADLKARDADGKDLLALVSASPADRKGKDAAARFFGPAGGCARLAARHAREGTAPRPVREAAVEENDCALGELYACGELGMRYDQGNGVATDLEKAVAIFAKACEGGAAWSCGKLAFRLESGRGTAVDLPRATALYEQACRAGEAWCCANRGVLAERGQGGPKDHGRAANWYDTACQGGHLGACAWLGRLYEKGLGVPRDLSKARELYRKACDGKEPDGCKGLEALVALRAHGS